MDCALYASEWVNILFVGITKAVLQLQIGLRGEVAAMVGVQGRFEEVHDSRRGIIGGDRVVFCLLAIVVLESWAFEMMKFCCVFVLFVLLYTR